MTYFEHGITENRIRPSAVANGLRNSIGTGALALGGVLGSIIIVRSLSITEYGKLSYYLWVASVAGNLGLLAFPPALTKVVSQLYGAGELYEADALVPWVGRLLFGLNSLIGLTMLAFAFFGSHTNRAFIIVIALSLLPGAIARVLNSRVLANEDYRTSMIASVTTAVVVFAGILIVHAINAQALGYEVVLVSGGAVQFTALYARIRPHGQLFARRNRVSPHVRSLFWQYLVPSTVLLLFDLVVWQRSEIFFLKLNDTLPQVGYYSISYTIFSIFYILGAALLNGLFPAASHDFGAGDVHQLAHKSRTGFGLAVFYGLPITFGGILGAPAVLDLFYGSQVQAAGVVSEVLMAGVLPGVLSVAMTLSLAAGGRVWMSVKVGAVFSAVNIALDLWLIPRYFALGASVANSLAQYGYCVVIVLVALYTLKYSPPWKVIFLCVSASVICVLAPASIATLMGVHPIWMLSVLVLGYGLYWGMCAKIGVWRLLHASSR